MLTRRNLRAKVLQSLYSYYETDRESVGKALTQLQTSIDKVYELSFWHLSFFESMVDSMKQRHEDAKAKFLPSAKDLAPDTAFIDNEYINLLINSRDLGAKMGRFKINWHDTAELVRRISDKVLGSKYYMDFISSDISNKAVACKFYKGVFNNIISKDAGYKSFFEEQHLDWATWEESKFIDNPSLLKNEYFSESDREYLFRLLGSSAELESVEVEEKSGNCSLVDYYTSIDIAAKMLSFVEKQSHVNFVFPPFYEVSITGKENEDIVFVKQLLNRTIENDEEFHEAISKRIKNWDVERITMIDIILLKMAITEFVDFPTVPVKATINEYIELSKVYGTTKSSIFVNGMLDKIMNDFTEAGRIRKQGRGLIS